MITSNTQELRDIADTQLAAILKSLPNDQIGRFILFIEVVRAMDYWGTHVPAQVNKTEKIAQSLDLMYWGWNRAVAELFDSLDQPGAFPLMESTPTSLEFASRLLQEFGKVSLLRRLADMSERGIMIITTSGDEYHIKMSEDARAQFADTTELDRLKEAEAKMPLSNASWTVASMRDVLRFPSMPGNYMAFADAPAKRWLRPDIEELIKPLVKPWNTGRGIMVAYDARIEVDEHYMAEALALATPWREDAGIHPDAVLGSITGADILGVGAALISLHVKHFGCVSVAKKLFNSVSMSQSLTIWGPRDTLEQSISVMSERPKPLISTIFNVLAMTAEQAKKLRDHSTPLIPMLFDLGNGFILRPVSCLTRNPFNALRTQYKWLNPHAENAFSIDRESWMREHLYGMFGGKRYIRFPGNLKLRRENAVLTDIDAVVYDRFTGDVALFQLKWQDYSTNDVRELRSKAANLSAELTDWSAKVQLWARENGISALNKSLRLKQKRNESVQNILLFAISRLSIRTQGYGVKTVAPDLAMGVWSQFLRVRMEIGPSKYALRDIHARLLDEHEQIPNIQPMPVTLTVAGRTIYIHDLWNQTDHVDLSI